MYMYSAAQYLTTKVAIVLPTLLSMDAMAPRPHFALSLDVATFLATFASNKLTKMSCRVATLLPEKNKYWCVTFRDVASYYLCIINTIFEY